RSLEKATTAFFLPTRMAIGSTSFTWKVSKRNIVMALSKPKTVDEYIRAAPEHAWEKLNELRSLLKSVAPNASEDLKWGQPVLVEKRILFSYSAFKKHLTFMPTGRALIPFADELAAFKTGEHTIQLPY